MTRRDRFLQRTESTNREAWKMAEAGCAHGSGVLATCQTAGRGRLDRSWFSPPTGNLYCSYVVRPALPVEDFPKLSLVAGVVTAEYLNRISSVVIKLKWPNDLLINGKKCGGILCESSSNISTQPLHRYVLVGIGVNLNIRAADFPEDLREIATSLVIEGAEPLVPEAVFHGLRQGLLAGLDDLIHDGFPAILERWNLLDGMRNSQLAWQRADGRRIEGKSLGLDEQGMLRIESAAGALHTVMTGDIRVSRN